MNNGLSFGIGLLAVCIIIIAWSLFLGTIPVRWPTFQISRENNPNMFWAYVAFFGLGAIVGVVLIAKALL